MKRLIAVTLVKTDSKTISSTKMETEAHMKSPNQLKALQATCTGLQWALVISAIFGQI